MATRFTEAQEKAITHRGSSILVAAAAGSGKTAVLVERIIRMIVDDNKDADKFLIVTFTKAAARELRSRISAAIDAALKNADSEKRPRLIDQKNRIALAQICTIDSFAANIVKSNAQSLGISSSFSVLSEKEIKILESDIASQTLLSFYEKANEENDENFYNFVEAFSGDKNDEACINLMTELNKKAEAFPFYDQYLDDLLKKSTLCDKLEEHAVWKAYLSRIKKMAEEAKNSMIPELDELISKVDPGFEKLLVCLNFRKNTYTEHIDYLLQNRVDAINLLISEFKPTALPYAYPRSNAKGLTSEQKLQLAELKPYADSINEKYKKLKELKLYSFDEFKAQIEKTSALAKTFIEIEKKYHENLMKYKIEHNKFSFNDIQHFAIELLCKPAENGEGLEPTDFAKEYRKNLVEICIDEFQDTNKTQCSIFESLSTNNLFMVGDMKQSIYRFRQAQPELFAEIRQSKKLSNGEDVEVIVLGNNFRSRKSVTDSTNYIFEYIMSEQLGDVDYNDDEKLIQSREFDDTEENLEFHLINTEAGEDDDATKAMLEANHIALEIKNKIDSGFLVQGKTGLRPCKPSDFFVLATSVKELAPLLVDELKKLGIGSYVEIESQFFESYEINLILNIVKVINNPGQDIPLASVMMSVLYGFSADDMASIRLNDKAKGLSLYSSLINQVDDNEKIKKLFDDLKRWRNLAFTMNAADFLRRLYDDTNIENYVELMPSPNVKRSNLSLLMHYASAYEADGNYGISNFIRYTDKLKDYKLDYEGSIDKSSSSNAVKIMTIHKSKGLQAPIVIVAGISKSFNKKEIKGKCIISNDYGFGFNINDEDENGFKVVNNTIMSDICKDSENSNIKSEFMRLLYVALTRAEERLILVGTMKFGEKNKPSDYMKISGADECVKYDSRLPSSVTKDANRFVDWIALGLLRHPDAELLRSSTGVNVEPGDMPRFGLDVKIISDYMSSDDVVDSYEESEADDELVRYISDAVNYVYPYSELSKELSKIAASEASIPTVHNEYFATTKPAFLSDDGFTAAQRGTLTHKFMQYIDFDNISIEDGEVIGVEEELFRLVGKNLFSEKEADGIYLDKVKKFFLSDIAKRMKNSSNLMREKRFVVHFDIDYFKPELAKFRSEDNLLTVQGVVDAAFVENGKLVIVDYKTDRFNEENQYISHYAVQLNTYRDALKQCTPYDVSNVIIYSFTMGKEIEIE